MEHSTIKKQYVNRPVVGQYIDNKPSICPDLSIRTYTESKNVSLFERIFFRITLGNPSNRVIEEVRVHVKIHSSFELIDYSLTKGTYSLGIWSFKNVGASSEYHLDLTLDVVSDNEFKPISVESWISHSSSCDNNLWNNFSSDSVYIYSLYGNQLSIPINTIISL